MVLAPKLQSIIASTYFRQHVSDFMATAGEDPFLFRHDKPPAHKFKTKFVSSFVWPPNSRDLDPVQHFQNELDHRLRDKSDPFSDFLVAEWDQTPAAQLQEQRLLYQQNNGIKSDMAQGFLQPIHFQKLGPNSPNTQQFNGGQTVYTQHHCKS